MSRPPALRTRAPPDRPRSSRAAKSVLAGTARNVLVIGAEKMTHAGADVVGAALLGASYEMAGKASTTGFTGLFAEVAKHYEKRYGGTAARVRTLGDVLGSIAAKNHRNGMDNPYAQMHRDLGEEFCRTISEKNPWWPNPCAAPTVRPSPTVPPPSCFPPPLPAAPTAPVRLAGFGHANDFFPAEKRDPTEFAATRASWQRALAMAGVGSRTWTSPKCTTASPSPNCSCTRPWA